MYLGHKTQVYVYIYIVTHVHTSTDQRHFLSDTVYTVTVYHYVSLGMLNSPVYYFPRTLFGVFPSNMFLIMFRLN